MPPVRLSARSSSWLSPIVALALLGSAAIAGLGHAHAPSNVRLVAAAPIRSVDEYKIAVARAIHAGSPQFIHNRQPQALLRAVVLLDVRPAGDGYVATVRRQNTDEPTLTQRALDSVKRAALVPVPETLRGELAGGFIETWLFDTDGTFQVAAIAKKQKSE